MNLAGMSCAVIAVLLFSGCSKREEKEYTYETPEGKVKMKVDGSGEAGKMTIDAPEGKVTIDTTSGSYKATSTGKDGKVQTFEMGKADVSAFDGFTYPKSRPESPEGLSSTKNDEMAVVTGAFVTDDKADVVLAHYKNLLPGATISTADGVSTVTGKTPKGADLSVVIFADEESKNTKVSVTLMKKN